MAGKANKAATLPMMGLKEGFDLVSKVWGVTGLPTLPTPSTMAQFAARLPQSLPSMIAPTLDVEELDKRIADLRAVEQWLNLNLSMLRTTVQSLEVQRNTIATLKSFGGAITSVGAATTPSATPGDWPYAAGHAMPPMPGPPPAAPPPSPPPPARASTAAVTRSKRRDTAAASGAAMPLNPAAWWSSLQEQFTRIAATAAAEAQAAAKTAAKEKRVKESAKTPAAPSKPAARKRRRR